MKSNVLITYSSIFLILNLIFVQVYTIDLDDDLKRYLVNKILENTSYSSNELKTSLKSLQNDIIIYRNSKCYYREHGEILESNLLKFSTFFNLNKNDSFSSLISSLKEINDRQSPLFINLTKQIVNEFNQKCFDSNSLIDLFSYSNENDNLHFYKLISAQFNNKGCNICDFEKEPVASLQTWIFGIVFVSIISLSSVCGAFVIPFYKKKIYKKILMFLIAIAVGSLAGSGFLHLIPEAHGIKDDKNYSNHTWKGLVMMGGVYLFYLVEKILNILILRRKFSKQDSSCSYDLERSINKSSSDANENHVNLERIAYLKTREPKLEPNIEMRTHLSKESLEMARSNHHGHSHGLDGMQSVAPVAWMIIFGDSLHNFIDGLSIGAAFTESIPSGINICLAVICEEFPHELGDFAILINAGMSYPVALFFNFISACSCFAGLVVGITIGKSLLGANQWIYAIAGGMFLYISLCSMIPELNEMGEEIERDYLREMNRSRLEEEEKSLNDDANHVVIKQTGSNRNIEHFNIGLKIKIMVIQNIGILLGFFFMLLTDLYADSIDISKYYN